MHEIGFCFKIVVLAQDFEVLQVNTFFIFPFLIFRNLPMTIAMRIMISSEEIQAKVKELGDKINAHYAQSDKELVLIGLLRGSVIFMADLCRSIEKPHELDFMTVSSYGGGTVSTRDVKILKDLDGEIHGKDVLVVEDIIDSGNTLSKVVEMLKTRNPNSIELCTLVSKPSRREIDLEVKFLGFEVEDRFIVGYGLDFDQKYRHLPFIGEIGL
jgi:hypoxanthine phosphoribosyltransferase